jgi:hypothetical protein
MCWTDQVVRENQRLVKFGDNTQIHLKSHIPLLPFSAIVISQGTKYITWHTIYVLEVSVLTKAIHLVHLTSDPSLMAASPLQALSSVIHSVILGVLHLSALS